MRVKKKDLRVLLFFFVENMGGGGSNPYMCNVKNYK